jgi:hypothetical protein
MVSQTYKGWSVVTASAVRPLAAEQCRDCSESTHFT